MPLDGMLVQCCSSYSSSFPPPPPPSPPLPFPSPSPSPSPPFPFPSPSPQPGSSYALNRVYTAVSRYIWVEKILQKLQHIDKWVTKTQKWRLLNLWFPKSWILILSNQVVSFKHGTDSISYKTTLPQPSIHCIQAHCTKYQQGYLHTWYS